MEAEQRVSFESGQALVDRERHWHALNAALCLNEHADAFYRLVYGDKDTFLAAWLLTGATHALVPHRPYVDERCLFQRDFAGAPLFQHRTGAKWDYAGEQHALAGFVHLDACLTALSELRQGWSGRVFHAPARSLKARRAESEIAEHPRLRHTAYQELRLFMRDPRTTFTGRMHEQIIPAVRAVCASDVRLIGSDTPWLVWESLH